MLLPELLATLGDAMKYGMGHPLMEVKIEFKGIVGDLVVKSAYTVPESDEYPSAWHLEVVPGENVNFARIPPDGTAQYASLCGRHRPWNDNGRCAEMRCWNYVEKHKDDPIPQPTE